MRTAVGDDPDDYTWRFHRAADVANVSLTPPPSRATA
jgi:hypothetical protein